MKPRQWFRVENKADDPTVAEIHIIDVIGGWDSDWMARNYGYDMGITARAFVEQLAKLPNAVTTINLHINSPGGDVQAGINIANALREQQTSKGRTVETFIDGIAASTASVIAMAGSKVHIGDNALMMIHNPYSYALGTAADMRKTADVLDAMRGQIIATYQWHSSLTPEALASLMDAESWLDADQALAHGLATDKVAGLKAAASIDAAAAGKLTIPAQYRDRVQAWLKPVPTPAPAPVAASATDVLRLCREAECGVDLAETLIGASATLEQAQTRVTEAKAARVAAVNRAAEITALCASAKQPSLAADYIAGGMSVDKVRSQLTTITATQDKVEIDAGLKPDHGAKASGTLSASAIYAARNRPSTT